MSTIDAPQDTQFWDKTHFNSIFTDKPEKDGESCIMRFAGQFDSLTKVFYSHRLNHAHLGTSRHKSTPFGSPLLSTPDGKTRTIWDLFQAGKAKAGASGPYLGVREKG